MFKLTYKRQDGIPIRLVFDTKSEAEYWGEHYSSKNSKWRGDNTYIVEKIS
tara:strand:- start:97 stop:249 length:153 start_codon:yes stop_codon:yes gene_type:complete